MPFLTFLDYSALESPTRGIVTSLETKDKEIAYLRERDLKHDWRRFVPFNRPLKNILELAGIWKNVGADKMKVDKGYNEVKQFLRLERGDMREFCKNIDDNSIDMIFTDPPYEAKYIYYCMTKWLNSLSVH